MKKGLNREVIVDTAAQLAEERGVENLTLHELAGALGVKTASLYNHLRGMPELNARLTERAFQRMLGALQDAAQGRTGVDALRALACAYRSFALSQPQLYKSMLALPHFEQTEIVELKNTFMRLFHPVLDAYALSPEERIHFSRLIRSSLHGFVSLEAAGFFQYPLPPDESYAHMIDDLCERLARAGGANHG